MIEHGHHDPGSYTYAQIDLYCEAIARRESEDHRARFSQLVTATRGDQKAIDKVSLRMERASDKLNATDDDD